MDQETRQAIEQLRREIASIGQLGQGVTVHGDLQVTGAVDIRAGRFWALDANGVPRVILSGDNLMEEFGVNAHFIGFDQNRVPQFWLSADDGSGNFAAGDGRIDRKGIHINALRYALEHTYGLRAGRIELYEAGSPAWKFSYSGNYAAGDNANLITNGDFATGDTTNWETAIWMYPPGPTLTVLQDDDGYYGHVEVTESGIIRTGLYNVTAGRGYKLALKLRGLAYVHITPNVGDSHFVATGHAGDKFEEISLTYRMPAGATQARVTVYANSNFDIREVRFSLLDIYRELLFDNDGFSVLDWAASALAGHGQNTTSGSSYTDQVCPIRILSDAFMIEQLGWYIRHAGSYQLRHTWDDGRANSYQTLWTGSAPGSSKVTIPLATPLVLPRGMHYLALVKTDGPAAMYGYTSAAINYGSFIINRAYYDGAQSGSTLAPVEVTGRAGAWTF